MKKLILGLAAASALAMASSANAGFVMLFDVGDNGSFEAIISDNQGDSEAVNLGAFGAGFFTTIGDQATSSDAIGQLNVKVGAFTTILSTAITGTETGNPVEMSSTVNVTSTDAGKLAVYISDDTFIGANGYSFSMTASSVASGSLTGQAFSGTSLFDLTGDSTSLLSLLGPNPSSQGADDFNALLSSGSPYSLTQKYVFDHTAAGTTNLTGNINIPEPSVLALFGLGLIGMGVARRRMKK